MLKKVCHVLKEVVVEHHMEDNFELIYVYAGHGKNGAVFEEIPAQFIKANQYINRLVWHKILRKEM